MPDDKDNFADNQVVDTHVHLWDVKRFAYPWLREIPALDRSFLLDDYRSAIGNVPVTAMVFVQCDAAPAHGLDEARWVAELARGEPRLRAVVAWAPLEHGDAAALHLDALKAIPLVHGVRRLIQSEPMPCFCLQPRFLAGVRRLAEYGFSFDILISHTQLADAIKMVRACPGVNFILDHIAKPDIGRGVFEPWAREIKDMATCPNVCCKVSGVITEADHRNWCKEEIKRYLDHVLNCFGCDRIIYGGDWPVVTLAGTYRQWFEALAWVFAGITPRERRKIFYSNAVKAYQLN